MNLSTKPEESDTSNREESAYQQRVSHDIPNRIPDVRQDVCRQRRFNHQEREWTSGIIPIVDVGDLDPIRRSTSPYRVHSAKHSRMEHEEFDKSRWWLTTP